jgi:pimeloyl-ACP methyl ester carboxylesterase
VTPSGTRLIELRGSPLEVLDLPALPGRHDAEPPLVLLHEGLGSVGLWRDFPARLHELTGRRLIAFSRHGHGRSGPPPQPRTPAFFHEEALDVLPELLGELGVLDPVLVGHSDGASIAIIHAAHHSVAAVVLLAPHVIVEEITVAAIRETRTASLEGGLRQRMARHHVDPDAAFWGWCDVWLDLAFRTWALDDEVARLTAPALLIQGLDDPYGSMAQIERIEARCSWPHERLALPGGHSPHLEHGELVAARVAEFVAEFAATGRAGEVPRPAARIAAPPRRWPGHSPASPSTRGPS